MSRPIVLAAGISLLAVACAHPDDTRWPATHAAAHRRPVDPSDMMTLLAACMEARLEQWGRGAGQASIVDDWAKRSFGMGTRVQLGDGLEGVFRGLASSGAMQVQLADGTEHLHHAGDVEWREALAGMT